MAARHRPLVDEELARWCHGSTGLALKCTNHNISNQSYGMNLHREGKRERERGGTRISSILCFRPSAGSDWGISSIDTALVWNLKELLQQRRGKLHFQ